jgi:hypothetical protein
VLSQHSKGRTSALTGSPLGIFVLALDTTCRIPLPAGRESTGKQMNQAAASLVRIMEDYESYRYGESLSLTILYPDIFGNIILRHLMRANLQGM